MKLTSKENCLSKKILEFKSIYRDSLGENQWSVHFHKKWNWPPFKENCLSKNIWLELFCHFLNGIFIKVVFTYFKMLFCNIALTALLVVLKGYWKSIYQSSKVFTLTVLSENQCLIYSHKKWNWPPFKENCLSKKNIWLEVFCNFLK